MKKPGRIGDKSREKSTRHSEALKAASAEASKRLNIEIPESLHARIKIAAVQRGITMQELVVEAVNKSLTNPT